jgi:6-phosphogluconolactonase
MRRPVQERKIVRFSRCFLGLAFVFVMSVLSCRVAAAQGNDYFMYFGTYTGFKFVSQSLTHGVGDSRSQGIYVSRLNSTTGNMGDPQLAAKLVNPAFLAIHPNHRFLYAVTEDPLSVGPPLDHASYVSAFAIDPASGKLRLLNTLPTGGTSTCQLSMDKTGKFVLLANFGSGSVSVLRVRDDGSLGEQTAFIQHIGHSASNIPIQSSAHPHSILVSPDNRHVVVSDLGLDKLFVYHFDDGTGALSPLEAPSVTLEWGAGPRHFSFDPAGKFGYSLNEMGSTLNVFAWDATRGALTPVQVISTKPAGFDGRGGPGEIQISNDGKFLYESNRMSRDYDRLPGTIGLFAIDPAKGTLTEVEQTPSGGVMPRSFGIEPTGRYLFALHQLTNNVVELKINSATGRLTGTGKEIKVDTPVCLQFVPVPGE